MIFIFGGVYQGKLAYAQERFGIDDSRIYRCNDEDTVIPSGKKIIYEIDRWILALIRANADIAKQVRIFIENNGDAVIICNDISCGVVPIDAQSRKWREETGRAMAAIANQSDEVIRLFCGIASKVKLKREMPDENK